MKTILGLLLFTISFPIFAQAECAGPVDLLIVGDSQLGATWSKSYTGNFLQHCLKGNFVVYARGGSIPGNWLGQGGMDQIETIQRDPQNEHLNIGSLEKIPLCKKRILPMLSSHLPKKVMFEFGGNYIAQSDEFIANDIRHLMATLDSQGISQENCFFLHQTYEMEVETKRNVPLKNIENTQRILAVISKAINGRCQIINGLEVMKDSPYFDGKEHLKRIAIEGRSGCMGAAVNDNAHVCGEAARDFAERICHILNNN